jgi:hypothetical protein
MASKIKRTSKLSKSQQPPLSHVGAIPYSDRAPRVHRFRGHLTLIRSCPPVIVSRVWATSEYRPRNSELSSAPMTKTRS